MQESIVFLVRVQCRRKESSRSLSHLLMSFLLRKVASTNGQTNKRRALHNFLGGAKRHTKRRPLNIVRCARWENSFRYSEPVARHVSMSITYSVFSHLRGHMQDVGNCPMFLNFPAWVDHTCEIAKKNPQKRREHFITICRTFAATSQQRTATVSYIQS